MRGVPRGITESLSAVVYAQRAIAYLQVDADLNLAAAGGHLAHYGLGSLRIGAPANEQAVFIEGFLPLPESPFFVRAMEFATGRVADVQFYADGASVRIRLVAVTHDRDAERLM